MQRERAQREERREKRWPLSRPNGLYTVIGTCKEVPRTSIHQICISRTFEVAPPTHTPPLSLSLSLSLSRSTLSPHRQHHFSPLLSSYSINYNLIDLNLPMRKASVVRISVSSVRIDVTSVAIFSIFSGDGSAAESFQFNSINLNID